MAKINSKASKMLSNRGFTLIEVLVASLILFIVILTLNAAFKQYTSYRIKQEKYELLYMSVLSLKDKLENEDLSRFSTINGKINGLDYTANVKAVARNRNYVYGFTPKESGNKGAFLITLYKITLKIAGKTFVFYKTQYKKAVK